MGKQHQYPRRNRFRPIPRWSVILLLLGFLSAGIFLSSCRRQNDPGITNASDAVTYVKALSEAYGYENAFSELKESATTQIGSDSYYRLQQLYQGIPVYGRTVVLAADKTGTVISITGNPLDVDTALKLTPTITHTQALEAAHACLTRSYGIEADCAATNQLYIYNIDRESLLAYCVTAGQYKLLVDAHTGDIITIQQILNAGSASPYAWKVEDGSYILRDDQRNIYIYDAGKQAYWDINTGSLNPSVLSIVSSRDDVFGNRDDSTKTASAAVSFLESLASVYDYFYDALNGETGCGVLVGIYDEIIGNNAGGGILRVDSSLPTIPPDYDPTRYGGNIGAVIMGTAYSEDFSGAIGLIGHEYTHVLTDKYVNWCHSSVVDTATDTLTERHPENGAIREGISDIFGALAELSILGKTDWCIASRIISDPSAGGYPEKLQKVERNKDGWIPIGDSGTDYSHGYSTLISHAAYLMWNGIHGTPDKKIAPDALAELWYRTILMMPSDCTFAECRSLVLLAAASMDRLTEAQRDCVAEAFDAVGIYNDVPPETEVTYPLKPGSTLTVLDKQEQPYTGYTLEITGLKDTVLWTADADGKLNIYTVGSEYAASVTVNEAPFTLALPNGYYCFTITDPSHPNLSYSFSASIRSSGLDDEVLLYTDFAPIVTEGLPAYYAQTDNLNNLLIVHDMTETELSFTVFWYKVWDISQAQGERDKNTVSFQHTVPGDSSKHASGTIVFQEDSALLTLNECTLPNISAGTSVYQLVGRRLTEEQLRMISGKLNVPEDMDVQITQSEPAYWSKAGFFTTAIDIYCDGTWIAGGSVHSLTGELVGKYYPYAPKDVDMDAMFGFTKVWEIHDRTESEYFVSLLAFQENGTFCCAAGWYLSEWYLTFTGTYQTQGPEIILRYTIDGKTYTTSYEVDWDNRILTQTSEATLTAAHPIGTACPLEENQWYTAETFLKKINGLHKESA